VNRIAQSVQNAPNPNGICAEFPHFLSAVTGNSEQIARQLFNVLVIAWPTADKTDGHDFCLLRSLAVALDEPCEGQGTLSGSFRPEDTNAEPTLGIEDTYDVTAAGKRSSLAVCRTEVLVERKNG
jgi:hypothetical protein